MTDKVRAGKTVSPRQVPATAIRITLPPSMPNAGSFLSSLAQAAVADEARYG
jgi:hypothetical protein